MPHTGGRETDWLCALTSFHIWKSSSCHPSTGIIMWRGTIVPSRVQKVNRWRIWPTFHFATVLTISCTMMLTLTFLHIWLLVLFWPMCYFNSVCFSLFTNSNKLRFVLVTDNNNCYVNFRDNNPQEASIDKIWVQFLCECLCLVDNQSCSEFASLTQTSLLKFVYCWFLVFAVQRKRIHLIVK